MTHEENKRTSSALETAKARWDSCELVRLLHNNDFAAYLSVLERAASIQEHGLVKVRTLTERLDE
jgi:hypothetical protein